MGPIPWTSVVMYSDRYGLEPDVSEAFVDIIREMDNAYMEHYSKEQKKMSDIKKPLGKGSK